MRFLNMSLIVSLCGLLAASAADTNWPQFRGPNGNGVSGSLEVPLKWSEQQNVRWKTEIHDKGWSSPVIWGGQVWVSTATKDGRQLFAICVDRETGKVVKDLKLFDVTNPQSIHTFNSYASPTPVIEEGRLYVTFGSPGTACVDTHTGNVLWTRRDLQCNHFRGAGSSPILYQDLFILNFDGSDLQYVVALNKATGQTVWRTTRSIDFQDLGPDGQPEGGGDLRKAFATCQVATLDGRATLLSQGSRALYAYDPLTGAELWRVEERSSFSGCTRPVVGHGLIFIPSGFASGQLLAIHPGKKGEVLDAREPTPPSMKLSLAWKVKRHVPKKPSLVLVGDLLFGIEDTGVATCWDAATGAVVWSTRVGGQFSASPLAVGDRIYLFSEEGKTIVLAAHREFKKLAENELDDGFMASPAVSGRALFLRTRAHLYRVEGDHKSF